MAPRNDPDDSADHQKDACWKSPFSPERTEPNARFGLIAPEMRCPRCVRSSLNFRHNVAASRTSKWATKRT